MIYCLQEVRRRTVFRNATIRDSHHELPSHRSSKELYHDILQQRSSYFPIHCPLQGIRIAHILSFEDRWSRPSPILLHHTPHTCTHSPTRHNSQYSDLVHATIRVASKNHRSSWLKVHPRPPSPENEATEASEELNLTSSSFVWTQGNEKVKPKGSFLSLICSLSMKLARHSAMWSNS